MKTCTITLHCTDNAGSTLQTYALQKFLVDNGIENEVIDYRPKYLLKYGNPIKRMIKEIVFHKVCKSQREKNLRFEKRNIKETTETYHTYEALKSNPPEADVYITGSDQIWNMSYTCGKDDAFYLKFVEHGKKIAYAASIGKDSIPEEECITIRNRIDDFDSISIREQSSVDQIQPYVSLPIECVCDPVLLLEAQEYKKIEKRCLEERFILVYLVQPSELLDEVVGYIRSVYKCKVVLIFGVKDSCECDIHVRDLSPDEFLWYIDNAEFVIASSFHAMMFSHIFEKNFALILPEKNQARIKHFLKVSGLSDRIIKTSGEVQKLDLDINYEDIRPRIHEFANMSKKWILNAIRG